MKRVLLVWEPGRAGATALNLASRIGDAENAAVSVIGVVPHATSGSRCGNSALDYNAMIIDVVAADVAQACEQLRAAGVDASSEVLIDTAGDELATFAAAGDFDLVLLPARRRLLRAADHPVAKRLRHVVSGDVRVVASASPAERLGGGSP